MTADGKPLGHTDSNIKNGLSVEDACDDLIKALYLKRFWIILGKPYFQILAKVVNLSENLTYYMSLQNCK